MAPIEDESAAGGFLEVPPRRGLLLSRLRPLLGLLLLLLQHPLLERAGDGLGDGLGGALGDALGGALWGVFSDAEQRVVLFDLEVLRVVPGDVAGDPASKRKTTTFRRARVCTSSNRKG